MTARDITAADFQDLIENNDIVLIDFWAAWCGPCRAFAPVFSAAAKQHPDIAFAKVDTEAEQELAAAFQISSIPTLVAFRDRVMLYAQPGALPPASLEELIGRIRALDMDEVRRAVAAQQPA